MAVVVDANLLVCLATSDPRAEAVTQRFIDWLDRQETLNAPALAPFEVASALTRLIGARLLARDRLLDVVRYLDSLPIAYHALNDLGRVVEIATTLGRKSAYDASYLVLAEQLGAELWTLDGPLYRNASPKGFAVRLIEAGGDAI